MRKKVQLPHPKVDAAVGYAADERGSGVAYARLASGSAEHLLRVSFRVERLAGLDAREVGYAALTAVAGALRGRGVRRAVFSFADGQLVADVAGHRDLPRAMVLPYVRLRCALNQFDAFELSVASQESDLTQRARAEVALHAAA